MAWTDKARAAAVAARRRKSGGREQPYGTLYTPKSPLKPTTQALLAKSRSHRLNLTMDQRAALAGQLKTERGMRKRMKVAREKLAFNAMVKMNERISLSTPGVQAARVQKKYTLTSALKGAARENYSGLNSKATRTDFAKRVRMLKRAHKMSTAKAYATATIRRK